MNNGSRGADDHGDDRADDGDGGVLGGQLARALDRRARTLTVGARPPVEVIERQARRRSGGRRVALGAAAAAAVLVGAVTVARVRAVDDVVVDSAGNPSVAGTSAPDGSALPMTRAAEPVPPATAPFTRVGLRWPGAVAGWPADEQHPHSDEGISTTTHLVFRPRGQADAVEGPVLVIDVLHEGVDRPQGLGDPGPNASVAADVERRLGVDADWTATPSGERSLVWWSRRADLAPVVFTTSIGIPDDQVVEVAAGLRQDRSGAWMPTTAVGDLELISARVLPGHVTGQLTWERGDEQATITVDDGGSVGYRSAVAALATSRQATTTIRTGEVMGRPAVIRVDDWSSQAAVQAVWMLPDGEVVSLTATLRSTPVDDLFGMVAELSDAEWQSLFVSTPTTR